VSCRRHPVLIALALAAVSVAAPAQAADTPLAKPTALLSGRLAAAPGTFTRECHARYRPNEDGIATRDVRARGAGAVHVTLDGTRGDWDVAVFDAAGRLLPADASPDAQESASGWTTRAGTLHVQACRRTGTAASVPATLTLARIKPGAVKAAKADPPQLVSVITNGKAEERKLHALDLDLSEHAGKRTTGVVLHGAQDAAALRQAGLRWRVLVPDLVARAAATVPPTPATPPARQPQHRPSRAAARATARSPTTTPSSRTWRPRTPLS
jgi:hypothetical protein